METSKKNKNSILSKNCYYYKLFWIFVIGCIAGIIVETLWCFITTGHFESRTALVLGQFNPIYGLGALIMTFIYYKFKDKNIILIFIICMLIGGLFEYFCSLFQELIFGSVSWYYDADSLGILEKRTSIVFSILWGILGIIWVKFLYSVIDNSIKKIPIKIGIILVWILSTFLLFDILLSSAAVYRQKERRNNIPSSNFIQKYLDNFYTDEALKIIYPNMTIKK